MHAAAGWATCGSTASTSRRTRRSSCTSAQSGRIHGSDASIVDYNRGGTPLAEIVTEPDLRSAEQARDWLNLLRVTLRQLGVSDVNMEEGSLRCDANVSVRPAGSSELGTKTELKNMNSFRFLEQGINAEIERQKALVAAGEPVVQETLHFDPVSGRLSSLRSKEEAHDYRYFPEPDLVPVAPTEEMLEAARAALPELPAARAERYERDWGLPADTARLLAYEPEWGDYFEQVEGEPRTVANWVTELRAPGRLAGGRRAGRARQARRARRRAHRHRRQRAASCSTGSSPRAATRPRSSSARTSARWATPTSSPASSPR